MKNKIKNLIIFGIILLSVFLFIFLASALNPQEEIAQLEDELNSAGYDWLVDYSLRDDPAGPNLTYPSVEVYEENKNISIATFEKINEDKEYKIFLTALNGSQNIFDLKVLGGSVEFDYIVDPIILGNANSLNTNTTYENNFTHLNVSNSSIVGYWSFDEDFNSTYTFDYTNNSNDGTLVGGTIINKTGCIYGNCYTFDSKNDYININSAVNDLATTTTGTWSAWINPRNTTAQGAGLGTLAMYHVINAVNKWLVRTDSNPFTINTWTHVVIVQNGVNPVIYINGVAVAQTF